MAKKIFRPMLTYSDEFHRIVNNQYRRIEDGGIGLKTRLSKTLRRFNQVELRIGNNL